MLRKHHGGVYAARQRLTNVKGLVHQVLTPELRTYPYILVGSMKLSHFRASFDVTGAGCIQCGSEFTLATGRKNRAIRDKAITLVQAVQNGRHAVRVVTIAFDHTRKALKTGREVTRTLNPVNELAFKGREALFLQRDGSIKGSE